MFDPQMTPGMNLNGFPTRWLVIDTETNGIFQFKDKATGQSVPADAPGQPRMCSAALIFVDFHTGDYSEEKWYVQPDGWSVHDHDEASIAAGKKTASEVNGLTDDFLRENGVPVQQVLDRYSNAIHDNRVVSAFNAQFDCKVFRAELRRAGRPDLFDMTPNVCTMRPMTGLMKIAARGGRGYKFPTLVEAMSYFDLPFEETHDAMNDARAAFQLLRAMLPLMHPEKPGQTLLQPPRVHYAKNAPA